MKGIQFTNRCCCIDGCLVVNFIIIDHLPHSRHRLPRLFLPSNKPLHSTVLFHSTQLPHKALTTAVAYTIWKDESRNLIANSVIVIDDEDDEDDDDDNMVVDVDDDTLMTLQMIDVMKLIKAIFNC